jgi:hypothetical protein
MAHPETPTHRALRVLSGHRRGSSRPVVVETADGPYLAKLRGAAQGTAPLVAEIVVAELAEALELKVPPRAFISLEPDIPSEDRDQELREDLLDASHGLNLGFRFLDGAREIRKDEVDSAPEELAQRVLWLDARPSFGRRPAGVRARRRAAASARTRGATATC